MTGQLSKLSILRIAKWPIIRFRYFNLTLEERQGGILRAFGWIGEATFVQFGKRCERVSLKGAGRENVPHGPSATD
jgi:hypothetical protein